MCYIYIIRRINCLFEKKIVEYTRSPENEYKSFDQCDHYTFIDSRRNGRK